MTNLIEYNYANSLMDLLAEFEQGEHQTDRTKTGTVKKVNQTFTIDLNDEPLPVLHGKKMSPNNALIEMLWFLKGDTNIQYLKQNGVNYWDSWADPDGMLGRVYGKQFRDFNGVDQLKDLVDGLINNFDSRRHLINLWNASDLNKMNLPPCHMHYQLVTYLKQGKKCMDVVGFMRSGDSFLGVPYNMILFTTFGRIIEFYTGIKLNKVHMTIADYHLYSNHIEQAKRYVNNVFDSTKKVTEYRTKPSLERPFIEFDTYALSQFLEPELSGENFIKMIDFMYQNPLCYDVQNYTKYDHDEFIGAKVAV